MGHLSMQIIAGLSLKNLKPKVWELDSPYYLPGVSGVMVSYADFSKFPARKRDAMEQGLHRHLGIPKSVNIYLDNGAFNFLRKGGEVPQEAYQEFVQRARPDWYPIPQDYIPAPHMSDEEQIHCLQQTMSMNLNFKHDGFVPVIHISRYLNEYLRLFQAEGHLTVKQHVALGGIVPNLLRMSKAMSYDMVLESLRSVRSELADKQLHVFGIGGTATLHLATLFKIDSVDSTGWRNRAARGIVQLPGRGDRMVTELGSWRARGPNNEKIFLLTSFSCPACLNFGFDGLTAGGLDGFCNRATHNLWVLLNEVKEIETHLTDGNYTAWFESHLQNSIYLPLIRKAIQLTGLV